MGIGQIIGGPVGAPIYGARNIGRIGGGPAPIQQNPNVGIGFGMPASGQLARTAVIGMDQNPNVGMGFGMPPQSGIGQISGGPAPIQQNPNVGMGFGMPASGALPVQIGMDQVSGPVAPNQQATNQYQPYFQQMHQGVATLNQTLQQMENLPGQQYSGGNGNLSHFASKGAGGGI